jgi:cobalt-zinc-cadmium efflux system outer membrane protein
MIHHEKIKIIFLLGIALCLGTCIRYHPKELLPEKTLTDFQQRSLDSRELRDFFKANGQTPGWPITSWDLHSLTLVSFFYHPDLDVARARWAVAEAGRITAGERPNPDLGLTIEYNSSAQGSDVEAWSPGLSFDITIETAGKRGFRVSQARQLSRSAYLEIRSVAWQVRSRLRQTFLELYASQQQQTILSRQQQVLAENARVMEKQLAVGAISPYELAQARIALQNNRLELISAENSRVQARIKLASALGLPISALEGVNFDFAGVSQYDFIIPDGVARQQALLNRSDILSALADYAASQAALQLEVARQYPDIHLGPGYTRDQGDSKWVLGLSLSLPFFNINHGPIYEAQARRQESASRFLALQTTVLNDIDMAAAGLRSCHEQAVAAAEIAKNLEKQTERAQAMFKLGEISKAELLGIQAELSAAEISLLNARVKTQEALGALEDAIQDSPGLNAWLNKINEKRGL